MTLETNVIQNITLYFSSSYKNVVLFTIISSILYVLTLLFLAPRFFISVLSERHIYFFFQESHWLLYTESGLFGILLTIMYSFFGAVIISITISKMYYMKQTSSSTIVPFIPLLGFSCISCGLSLIYPISSSLLPTLFPYGGNLLRLISIGVMIYIISILNYTSHT